MNLLQSHSPQIATFGLKKPFRGLYWGEVNEGKKWCPIFQQKYVYLDGMKSVILLK